MIRVFHDMEQKELARRINTSPSHICELEKGRKQPSMDTLNRYSLEFNIPASSILFFAENLKDASTSPVEGERKRMRYQVSRWIINALKFIEQRTDHLNRNYA